MNKFIEDKLNDYRHLGRNRARLLIHCPDKPGIVAAVSEYLYQQDANIIESNQYSTDPTGGEFFLRLVFEKPDLQAEKQNLEEGFAPLAEQFEMDWAFEYAYQLKKMAVFVSKELHCLQELLWEWQSGDLMAELTVVISNHLDSKELVESLGIPFHYIPASKETRNEVEQQQLELLEHYQIDVIVLARYMQILTPRFVAAHPNRIINIHHSFLPAFIGAKPYERAYQRGVKLIGATSHYVTNDLDEGPIIEQDISRVDHRDNSADMKKIGQSIERSVLARAVKWHLEDRIIVHGNKTIVF